MLFHFKQKLWISWISFDIKGLKVTNMSNICHKMSLNSHKGEKGGYNMLLNLNVSLLRSQSCDYDWHQLPVTFPVWKKAVLPEGRDEISPIFCKISPKIFQKQKNSSKNHLNLHLKAFNKQY